VIELKRARNEKRARRVKTRPEPTFFGNCESWNFIVGKKPWENSPDGSRQGALQHSNRELIHTLSTIPGINHLDNLWVICGSTVGLSDSSHIVDSALFNMPAIPDDWHPF
jgi:hypothetical protein